MIRRTPRSTRTDTLLPYTTLFRSCSSAARYGRFPAIAKDIPTDDSQPCEMLPGAGREPRCIGKLSGGRYTPAQLTHFQGFRHEAPDLFPCRSEEHTSELQSLMRISYAVFCLKKKKNTTR